MTDQLSTTFRQFGTGDTLFANDLRVIANWNQDESDWIRYLEMEPRRCFIAEVEGHRAGTVTTIRYGTYLGWIGMALVHPDHRRRGLGTELVRRAIAYLTERGVGCVKLDATAMGRAVYLPMGFRDEYELTRYEGLVASFPTASSEVVSAFSDSLLPAVAEFDAVAFGTERSRVLASMMNRNSALCFVARDRREISGYLIAREGAEAIQLGPWAARNEAVAAELIDALLNRVPDRRILVDIPRPNNLGCLLIEKRGFARQRDFSRMYLGENLHPGKPSLIFGTSSAEKRLIAPPKESQGHFYE